MAYSAGTATVSVLPNLRGFVQKVRNEVKGIGPYNIELHPDLKKFTSLVNAEMRKSFGPVTVQVSANTSRLSQEMTEATRTRTAMVNADLNRASLAAIENALDNLSGTVKVTADSSAADLEIAQVRQRLAELRDKIVRLEVNGQQARSELSAITRDLERVDGAQVSAGVALDAGAAKAELQTFEAELARVDGTTASANIGVDPSKALGAIAAVGAAMMALRNPPPIMLNVDTHGFGAATAAAATLLGGLMAFGAVVPVLAGVAAAAAAIGPSLAVAGAGLASTLLAFSGVGKAVGALNDAQTEAGTNAKTQGKAMASAAESVRSAQQRAASAAENLKNVQANAADAAVRSAQAVRDAQQGLRDAYANASESARRSQQTISDAQQRVSDAHRAASESAKRSQEQIADAVRNSTRAQQNAARQVASAIETQRSAEKSLTVAVRDATRAQAALTDARNAARIALMSLSDQVIENSLAQRRAVLDLADAQRKAGEATASPEGLAALDTQRQAAERLAEAQNALSANPADAGLKTAAAQAALAFTVANNALADTADESVRAQIAYEEQAHSLDVLRRQGTALAAEKASADRKGIEGSTQVISAQEQILAANERVAESQRAVGKASAEVDRARIDGAESVADAQRRVVQAQLAATTAAGESARAIQDSQKSLVEAQRQAAVSAGESSRSIEAAQQRVADAVRSQAAEQRQSAYAISQAQQGVADAQRAVAQAVQQAGEAASGASAGVDKLGQAFANLSPAAAAFARYLFSLKPLLDDLKATAATNLFPGLTAGLQAQVGIFPVYKNLVAQTSAAMGEFFRIVLTGMANPFWQNFWNMIASQAMPIMQNLARVFLGTAGAVANLITHMMPAQGAFFGLLDAINGVLWALGPLLGTWGTELIPVVTRTVQLFHPLIDLLTAMTPLFVGLFNAVLPVVDVLIRGLTPVVQALTPFLIYLANAVGQWLIQAFQNVQPFLLGFAQWLSDHPQLALNLGKAILFVVESFKFLAAAFGLLHTFIVLFAIKAALEAVGLSVGGLLARIGPAFAGIAAFFSRLWGFLNPVKLLSAAIPGIGSAIAWVMRSILGALGPVGWIIIAFTTLYSSSESFRGAIGRLLGTLGDIVSMLMDALRPAFDAIMGVVNIIMGVFGDLVGMLAEALVPIIDQFSGILMQLAQAVMPLIVGIFEATAPILKSVGDLFLALWNVLKPIVDVVLSLFVQNMQSSMDIMQLVIPVIAWLAKILAEGLGWYVTNVIVPGLQALIGVIQWLADVVGVVAGWIGSAVTGIGNVFSFVGNIISTVWNAIGTALAWVYNTIIAPVFQWFEGVLGRAGWLMQVLWYAYIQPIWQAIADWIAAKYNEYIKPIFDAIGAALSWLGTKFAEFGAWAGQKWGELVDWLTAKWNQFGQPIIDVIAGALSWLGGKFGEFGDWVGRKWGEFTGWLQSQWDGTGNPIMRGIWDALDWVGRKFGEFADWVGAIWDRVWGAIDGAWQKIKPIFDAVGDAMNGVGNAFSWLLSGPDPATMPAPEQFAPRANGGVVTLANGGVVYRFAPGGSVPGYAPGRDTVPSLLSPGEGVLVPEAVRALGGPAAIEAINAKYSGRVAAKPGLAASSGVADMGLPGFANGGVVGAVRRFADGGVATAGASGAAVATGAGQGLPFTVEDTQTLTAAVDALTLSIAALVAQVKLLTAAGAVLTSGTDALSAATAGHTVATYVQTAAIGGETFAIVALIPQINLWNLGVVTVATSTSTLLTPAVLFLTNMALLPLVTFINAMLIPAFALLELHAGILAVNAILALAAQIPPLMAWFNQLLANINFVWTSITNKIVESDNIIAARTNQLQAEVSAAWSRMQTDVQNSISGMQVAIDGMMRALDAMRLAETMTADWTRDKFNEMRGHAAVPMHWILEFPFNAGIIAAWNALDSQFALGKHVNPVPIPFASGGVIPGHGAGTADDVPIMASSGEFMVREKVARQHYSFLSALNSGQAEARQAAGGSRRRAYGFKGETNPAYLDGGGGGYAGGGIIEAVMRAKQWAQSQSGKPYQWGGGGNPSWDCSGYMGGITNVLRGQTPGRIGSTADFPWPGFSPGLTGQFAVGSTKNSGDGIGHMAGTLGGVNAESAGSGKGVHFGGPARGADDGLFNIRASLAEAGGQFVSGGAGGGAGFDPTPVVDAAFKKAYDYIGEIPGRFGTSAFVEGSGAIARQAADGVKGKAMEKLLAMFASSGGALGPVGAGAPFYVAEISRAAKALALGKDAAIIGVATALVETGSLRMLANPSRPDSMAMPHDGIAQDFDSVGLFQQRANGAWGTTAQQMNAFASASMFFRKLASFDWRSMDPGAAAQKVQVSAFPGKYSQRMAQATGLVNQFGGFDDGGIAAGKGFMAKQTIAPERVLSPAQTQSFDALVATLGTNGVRLDSSGGRDGGAAFPTEFTITSGQLELRDDGLVRIIDGRLEAVTNSLTDGRQV